MKSIQSILMIVLAVFLIGMMPNLADGKTIKIKPDQLIPTSAYENYYIRPDYVSSADAGSSRFWAKIKFPKNADSLNKLIYYHEGYGGSTTVIIYRSKMDQFREYVWEATSDDDTGGIIKVTSDIVPSHKINTNWTYWVYAGVYSWNVSIHGIKIQFSIK